MHLRTIAMLKNNYTEVWYLLGQQLILVSGCDMYGKAVLIQLNFTLCLYYTVIFLALKQNCVHPCKWHMYFQLNQPTRCISFSSLLLVV